MKIKLIATICVASFIFAIAACGGAANTTANLANKAGNAANAVANSASNAVNGLTNSNANSSNTTTASGDTVNIDEAGIVMTVPKGFKINKDGEDTIVMTEDEGVDIRFTVPKDGDYEKVINDAAEELDSYLDEIKIEDKGSKVDVNGMEGTSMSGTAKDADGELVIWDLTIINAPKRPVLANIYAEKASMEKHGAKVKEFLKSVRKQ